MQAAGAHSPRDVVEPAAPVLGTAMTSRGSAPLSSSTGSEVDVTPRSRWPRFPSIYEINTWVWLAELAGKTGNSYRPRLRSAGRMGPPRRHGLRCCLADGRLGAKPGRHCDRQSERRAALGLPAGASRFPTGGQCRLTLLRTPLRRRPASRRTRGSCRAPERSWPSGACA